MGDQVRGQADHPEQAPGAEDQRDDPQPAPVRQEMVQSQVDRDDVDGGDHDEHAEDRCDRPHVSEALGAASIGIGRRNVSR